MSLKRLNQYVHCFKTFALGGEAFSLKKDSWVLSVFCGLSYKR